MSARRRGTLGLLDRIFDHVSAEASPSTHVKVLEEIERFCEALEDAAYEKGLDDGRGQVDVEAMIGGALDEIEDKAGRLMFDRVQIDEALAAVNRSGRRGTLQPRKLLPGSVEADGQSVSSAARGSSPETGRVASSGDPAQLPNSAPAADVPAICPRCGLKTATFTSEASIPDGTIYRRLVGGWHVCSSRRPIAPEEFPPFKAGETVMDTRGGAHRYTVERCIRAEGRWCVYLARGPVSGDDSWMWASDLCLVRDEAHS